jgi:hypothetical protein
MCVVADDVSPGLGLGGEDSPWAHDVPVPPAPPLPDSWTRDERAAPAPPDVPAPEFDSLRSEPDIVAGAPSGPRRSRPALVVVGIVGIVAALIVGSQFIGGDDGGEDDSDLESELSIPVPQRTDPTPSTVAPTRSTERARPEPPASLPEPEPVWARTRVELSPRLQAMTLPTEVVVLDSDAILHVIDVPTGVLHSIDTQVNGGDLAVVLGDEAIAVRSYNGDGVTVLDVDGRVYDVEIPGGAGEMVARPGTNDFVVTPNNWSGTGMPVNLLVAADGTTVDVPEGPLREYGVWALRYLRATGESIVDESGGTYAIDSAGAARRLSIGSLVAVGDNHVLVRECDEVLTCAYVRIDGPTGERLEVDLPDLQQYGYDPSLSLSPDGTMLTYFAWAESPPARRLVNMIDGTATDVDSTGQFSYNTAWAADSSGIFVIDDRTLVFYDRTTGDRIDVAPGVDLGTILAVAARPMSG